MKNKMTHTAIMIGCDARTPKNYKKKISVRETKNFYITKNGIKFKKGWIMSTVGELPLYRLQDGSIKQISEEVK